MPIHSIFRAVLLSLFCLVSPVALAGELGSSIRPMPSRLSIRVTPDGGIVINGLSLQLNSPSMRLFFESYGINVDQVVREIQEGTFDPADYQTQIDLIRKRLSNPDDVETEPANNPALDDETDRFQEILGADHDQWAVISPRIRNLLACSSPTPAFLKIELDLNSLLQNPDSSRYALSTRLKDYRDAVAAMDKNLASVQRELAFFLTPRQEAILVNLGYLK